MTRLFACARLLWILSLVGSGGVSLVADGPRFTAVLSDGRRVEGDEVRPWHATNSQPRLSGVDLFDANNPAIWLRDNSLPAMRQPTAFVEFFGGDVLPGQVVAYSSGDEPLDDPSLPFLVIEPEVGVDAPNLPSRNGVRVTARWLRRVVWNRRQSSTYEPGTLHYRDGRRVRFRSVRWGRSEVRLLLESGISQVPFGQIAELHLARRDPWDAYFDQLPLLVPDGSSRLVRIETVDGLRVTSSEELFRATAHGSASDPKNWIHIVQPAWSLDALWLRHRSVQQRVYSHAHQLPLSVLDPSKVVEKAVLGSSWTWQKDRCVQGGTLESGGLEFAWGFGVHARCELEFGLHESVRSFRSRVGLDHVVGDGGCARAEVHLRPRDGGETRRVWQSEILLGSGKVADVGSIDLTGVSAKGARLLLVVDPLIDERPPGADPFDVRDSVDWLEPTIELDPEKVRAQIRSRRARLPIAFDGWEIHSSPDVPLPFRSRWDESAREYSSFRQQLLVGPEGLVISRRVRLSTARHWLFGSISTLPGAPTGARVELEINGVKSPAFSVPARSSNAPAPSALLVPLPSQRGEEVELTLRIQGPGPDSEVDVRALVVTENEPGVREIFEDDLVAFVERGHVDGPLLFDWRESRTGSACIEVGRGDVVRYVLDGPALPIREHPRYGEFRYLRFAWKKSGGGRVGLGIGHGGRWGPSEGVTRPSFRFDQGRGDPVASPTRRLSQDEPKNWVMHTTDLAGIFGEFPLTGIEFFCPDGESAFFDHIWLARSKEEMPRSGTLPFLDRDDRRRALVRKIEPRRPRNVSEIGECLGVVAPGFEMHGFHPGKDDSGIERPELLAEYLGRPGVLRTHPRSVVDPCVLRRKVRVKGDVKASLSLSVSHHFRGDWNLVVRVDGESLVERPIGPLTAPDGWLDLEVDLSPFAGQEVTVEILNQASRWAYEHAYWWMVVFDGIED